MSGANELQHDLAVIADNLVASGRASDAVQLLTSINRRHPSREFQVRLVRARHAAYRPSGAPRHRTFEVETRSPSLDASELPEVVPSELTASVLRSALSRHGAAVVRGLLSQSVVDTLLDDVRRTFTGAAVARTGSRSPDLDPWFVPFAPEGAPELGAFERDYCWELGTALAADAPRTLCNLIDSLHQSGVAESIEAFFGERPAISAKKTSLRWVPPRPSALMRRVLSLWHQDGAFLGRDIRAVNVWVALTPCGTDAPSIEFVVGRPRGIVPRRGLAKWSAGGSPPPGVARGAIARPKLDTGDAVVFDHFTLHRTHMSPHMTRERYGIECWFFAPSTYPANQVPLIF